MNEKDEKRAALDECETLKSENSELKAALVYTQDVAIHSQTARRKENRGYEKNLARIHKMFTRTLDAEEKVINAQKTLLDKKDAALDAKDAQIASLIKDLRRHEASVQSRKASMLGKLEVKEDEQE